MDQPKQLLMIVELGGYPDYSPLYLSLGYDVEVVTSGRKAISYLKTHRPAAVVAEFNYMPDFRDRMGWLESVLATLQQMPQTHMVVFYQPEEQEQLNKLRQRFANFIALPQPVDATALEAALR
jgi:CheY-like chemotaxis protein